MSDGLPALTLIVIFTGRTLVLLPMLVPSMIAAMCERFSFALSKEKIARRFHVKAAQVPAVNYNISPGQLVPVISNHSPKQLSSFHWGMMPPANNGKKSPQQVNVIGAEAFHKQPYFAELLQTKRCLIPADGFYMWRKISKKGKIPYRVVLKWNLSFAFAGIWDAHTVAESEHISYSCTILSTTSNQLLSGIEAHMPVILPLEFEQKWLDANMSLEEARSLLLPYPSDKMNYFPVSTQINIVGFNSPLLLQPTQPTDQFGNYVLFD